MFKDIFFKFLDVSGILMGIFLVALGAWIISGREVGVLVGWIVLVVGIGAFLIHTGHYFNLKYMQWVFGPDYFVTQESDATNNNEREKPTVREGGDSIS